MYTRKKKVIIYAKNTTYSYFKFIFSYNGWSKDKRIIKPLPALTIIAMVYYLTKYFKKT